MPEKILTIKNKKTGRTVRVNWMAPGMPTREDIDAMFAEQTKRAQESVRQVMRPPAPPEGKGFATSLYESVVPGTVDFAKKLFSPQNIFPTPGKSPPLQELGSDLVESHKEQFRKAGEKFKEGKTIEGLGYGALGALPLVGPAFTTLSEQAGEQAGQGDISGALGTGAGALLTLGAPSMIRTFRGSKPVGPPSPPPSPISNVPVRVSRLPEPPLKSEVVGAEFVDMSRPLETPLLPPGRGIGKVQKQTGQPVTQQGPLEQPGGFEPNLPALEAPPSPRPMRPFIPEFDVAGVETPGSIRNRIAIETTGRPYEKLSGSAKRAVDDLIKEGHLPEGKYIRPPGYVDPPKLPQVSAPPVEPPASPVVERPPVKTDIPENLPWRSQVRLAEERLGNAEKPKSSVRRFLEEEKGEIDYSELGRVFKSGFDKLKEGAKNTGLVVMPLDYRVKMEGKTGGREVMNLVNRARDYGDVDAGQLIFALDKSGLKNLSREERLNLSRVIQAKEAPISQNVADIAPKLIKEILNPIGRGAEGLGMTQMLPNYFPHVIRKPELYKSGQLREDVIDNLQKLGVRPDTASAASFLDDIIEGMESGNYKSSTLDYLMQTKQAPDRATALRNLQRYGSKIKRHAHLEHHREVNLPIYDPDPARVLPHYVTSAARRMREVEQYGPRGENIDQLVLKIADEGGNPDFVRKVLDEKIIGFDHIGETPEAWLSKIVRAYNAFKLTTAAIPNAFQGNLNTLLMADAPSVVAGWSGLLTKRGREFGVRSGAAIQEVLNEATRELGGPGVIDKYLKTIGMTLTERWNRIFSANAGVKWLERNVKKFSKGDESVRGYIEELGIDPDVVARQGYKLTEYQRLLAGKKFSDMSQGRFRPSDLPLFASSSLGRVWFQFRGYAYNQAKIIARGTIEELKAGRPGRFFRTLFILGTVFPIAGEITRMLRDALTGRTQDFESVLTRYLVDLTHSGGAAIFGDIAEQSARGRMTEFMAGSAGADAAELAEILFGAKELTPKRVVRRGPYGSVLQRAVPEEAQLSKVP